MQVHLQVRAQIVKWFIYFESRIPVQSVSLSWSKFCSTCCHIWWHGKGLDSLFKNCVHTECCTPVFLYAHVHAWRKHFYRTLNKHVITSLFLNFFFPIYDIITLQKYFADLWNSLWGIRDCFCFDLTAYQLLEYLFTWMFCFFMFKFEYVCPIFLKILT